jgi:hypothetical protein
VASSFQFERLRVSRLNAGRKLGDELRVAAHVIGIGHPVYERMGYPESLTVELSTDGRAIHLIHGGDFKVTTSRSKGNSAYYSLRIPNGLKGRFKRGQYFFLEDNIFVLDPSTAVE